VKIFPSISKLRHTAYVLPACRSHSEGHMPGEIVSVGSNRRAKSNYKNNSRGYSSLFAHFRRVRLDYFLVERPTSICNRAAAVSGQLVSYSSSLGDLTVDR
jgi:hypothetical protein